MSSNSSTDEQYQTVLAAEQGSCYVSDAQPFILQTNTSCAPHFFCPNSTQENGMLPSYCIPSSDCEGTRLNGLVCDAQGVYEPMPCKPGFYCPDQYHMLPCPAGNFCPVGRVSPIPCQPLSVCNPGSQKETPYLGFVLCLVIDVLIFVGYRAKRFFDGRKSGNRAFEDVIFSRIADLNHEKPPFRKLMSPTFLYMRLIKGKKGDDNRKHPTLSDAEKHAAVLQAHEDENGDMTKFSQNQERMVANFRSGFNGLDIRMNFIFSNLGLTLQGNKTILRGVSGEIRAGRLTAIMGPSGAGKTTFMNVLMGKVPRTHGRLFVNGREAEMHQFKKIIGYVPQEDTMLRELTVYENVYHAARIKLPPSWTNQRVQEYVWTILSTLNLSHVAHIPIGDVNTRGISGGQRKRTNIALELAAIPLAIFLDEPTSGLDATSALTVTQTLKALSRLGLTIVAVIHQPRAEICREFDDVVMIAPGGRTAYQGAMSDAQPYFEALGYRFETGVNPADILMDILSGMGINEKTYSPSDLIEIWARTANLENHHDPVVDSFKKPSVMQQVRSRMSTLLPWTAKHPSDADLTNTDNTPFVNRELSYPYGSEKQPQSNDSLHERKSFSESRAFGNVRTSPIRNIKGSIESGWKDTEASDNSQFIAAGDPGDDNQAYKLLGRHSYLSKNGTVLAHGDTERLETELDKMNSLSDSIHREYTASPSPAANRKRQSNGNLESFLCFIGDTALDHKPHMPSPLGRQRRVISYTAQTSSNSEESDYGLQGDVDVTTDIQRLNTKRTSGLNTKHSFKEDRHPESIIINAYDEESLVRCVDSSSFASHGTALHNFQHQVEDENTAQQNELFHRSVGDLVRSRGAMWHRQMQYCFVRAMQQQYRSFGAICLEIFVGSVAGFLMGISVANQNGAIFSGSLIAPYTLLSPTPLNWLVPQLGLLVGLAIALAAAPGGVKLFGEERTVFWRESASGHNRVSYYVGKTVASIPRIVISSLHFTSIYLVLACPPLTLARQYPLHMLQFFGVYGVASIVSMIIMHTNANLLAVVFCMFVAVFCGYGPNLNQARDWHLLWVWDLSYNRWSTEATLDQIASVYEGLYDIPASISRFGYRVNMYERSVWYMVALAVVQRIVSFFLMILLYRDKQR